MKHTIGIVCIVKNEAEYILEWIAHYRSLGLNNLLIYNNESTDRTGEILSHLQHCGVVKVFDWAVSEGVSPQLSAYANAVDRFHDQFEFLAFFDADEFLTPRQDFNIVDWLSALGSDVGAIAINQRVFGSSGQKAKLPGLVIDRFRRSATDDYDENRWVKSIYRCSCIREIRNSHRGILSSGRYIMPNGNDAFSPDNETGKADHTDFSRLQLNHYIIKSEEEFLVKQARGGVVGATIAHRLKRYEDPNFFHGRDAYINAVAEETLARRLSVIETEIRSLEDLIRETGSRAEPSQGLAT